MTNTKKIILNNLSFQPDHLLNQFSQVSLTLDAVKYGIVGGIGAGKTTFLKLILGMLSSDTGSVQCEGKILYVPQSHSAIKANESIASALGVNSILQALNRINNGSTDEKDFESVANYWHIEELIKDALKKFNLWPIDRACPIFGYFQPVNDLYFEQLKIAA